MDRDNCHTDEKRQIEILCGNITMDVLKPRKIPEAKSFLSNVACCRPGPLLKMTRFLLTSVVQLHCR